MDAPSQLTRICRNEKGIAIVFVALLMVVLIGFLGLAIDTAHLYTVRGELQNAADAAAMKGAWYLYSKPADPTVLAELQLDVARAKAQEVIAGNLSDGRALPDLTVDAGCWKLGCNTPSDCALIAPTLHPRVACPSGYVGAVTVEIKRDSGSNGGKVDNFFVQVLNPALSEAAVASQPAVAVSGYPGVASRGDLFPLAISRQVTDAYFSLNPLPNPPITMNLGYGATKVNIAGIEYHTGQWTSFLSRDDNANYIRELILTGNPEELAVGDAINIAAGVKNTLYTDDSWLPAGGKDVVLAVVENGTGDFTANVAMPIVGFATFRLDSVHGGNDKYITGHFTNFSTAPQRLRPGGNRPSNTVTPPLLVQYPN